MSTWDLNSMWNARPDPESTGGTLTLEDMDRFIDHLKEQAATGADWVFELSPGMAKRVRWLMLHSELLMKMYRAYPPPHRKIRKCHMRKLQARWHVCRRRIRKIEQAVMAAEESKRG